MIDPSAVVVADPAVVAAIRDLIDAQADRALDAVAIDWTGISLVIGSLGAFIVLVGGFITKALVDRALLKQTLEVEKIAKKADIERVNDRQQAEQFHKTTTDQLKRQEQVTNASYKLINSNYAAQLLAVATALEALATSRPDEVEIRLSAVNARKVYEAHLKLQTEIDDQARLDQKTQTASEVVATAAAEARRVLADGHSKKP